jgi:DnaK suppressor protein
MKENPQIKFPRTLLNPVSEFLSSQLKHLERTQKKVAKDDPFNDKNRDPEKAAPDAAAEEQVGHIRTVALQLQLSRRIIQTRRALTRVKMGTYGTCQNCGKMIDTDRLMIYPEATLCVSCERKKEKKK